MDHITKFAGDIVNGGKEVVHFTYMVGHDAIMHTSNAIHSFFGMF